MFRRTTSILAVLAVTAAMTGCSFSCSYKSTPHHRAKHQKRYGKIYHDQQGHAYTRSYGDDGMFWYWMYITNADGGGTWSRVTEPPSNLTPTSQVVAEEDGKPGTEVQEEGTVPAEETITETTTENDVAALDSSPVGAEESGDVSSGDSSGDTGSSDSGGDTSSDAGGGDSGGGDGGGGE